MIIRVLYESYGIQRGYDMYCRRKQDMVSRLNRLGVLETQIDEVWIDGVRVETENLFEKDD